MKKQFTLIIILFIFLSSYATTHVITNVSAAFSPSTITINVNDSINFQIGSIHNAVEVSLATWQANGTTSNGGFSLPLGGGKIKFSQVGTFYYVCQPHASLQMKGTITVIEPAAIQITKSFDEISVFANNASNSIHFNLVLQQPSHVKYSIYNITGKKVLYKTSSVLQVGEISNELSFGDAIAKGLYIVEIAINDKKYTKKIFFNPLN